MSDLVVSDDRQPFSRDVAAITRQMGLPEDLVGELALYAALAKKMYKRKLSYLALPAVLASLGQASWYEEALCWGRAFYYDSLFAYDEVTDSMVRVPEPYERDEIREHIQGFLTLDDPRIAVAVPLSWRVGVTVGWLSGLSTSQRDDAQAGMIMVAALVAPLLVSQSPGRAVPQRASSGTAASSRKALRPGKSKKSSRRSKAGRK